MPGWIGNSLPASAMLFAEEDAGKDTSEARTSEDHDQLGMVPSYSVQFLVQDIEM